MATHLTDSLVKALPAPEKANRITYDDDPKAPGFGVRTTAGGVKAFILNYRTTSGRERRMTIGRFPKWRTSEAREKAARLSRDIDDGVDPLQDRIDDRAAPTVLDLIQRFEEEHLTRRKASTAEDYKRMIRSHIGPAIGRLKVADVEFSDIDGLHRKITKKGHLHRANRVVAVASKMFSLAMKWNMRPDNPCRGVEKNTEHHRQRYLKGDELARLVAALANHSDQQAANVVRMLMFTGARRGEVLSMRWADVDMGEGTWTKPAASTKSGRDHSVPLSAPALALLAKIRADAGKRPLGTYVFPGDGEAGHLGSLKKSWRSLCKAAGIIESLRIHDLRHSFASQLASSGASLPLIGALLGHSSPTTTHRYAHLFSDPQREAAERVGAVISNAGKPTVEPVSIVGRRRR
jgi:integrase